MATKLILRSWGIQIDKEGRKVLPDHSNARACAFCQLEVVNDAGGLAYTVGYCVNPPSRSRGYNSSEHSIETLDHAAIWQCQSCKNYNWAHANERCANWLVERGLWPKELLEEVPD